MEKKEKITTIMAVILFIGTLFSNELRVFLLSLSWDYYIFGISILLLSYSLLSFTIRKLFKREFKKYIQKTLDDASIENSKIVKKLDKQVSIQKELIEHFKKTTRINTALIKRFFIYDVKSKDLEVNAKHLYSFKDTDQISIIDWENFGVPREMLNKIKELYHKEELTKVSQKG